MNCCKLFSMNVRKLLSMILSLFTTSFRLNIGCAAWPFIDGRFLSWSPVYVLMFSSSFGSFRIALPNENEMFPIRNVYGSGYCAPLNCISLANGSCKTPLLDNCGALDPVAMQSKSHSLRNFLCLCLCCVFFSFFLAFYSIWFLFNKFA